MSIFAKVARKKAHLLLAAPFVVDGFSALRDPDPHAERVIRAWNTVSRRGGPELDPDKVRLAARAGGAAAILTSSYLVVGKHKRVAASILAATTVPLALINAPVWLAGDKYERKLAGRKLLDYGALGGGLLLASVDLDGKPSRKWRKKFRLQEKELVATSVDTALAAAGVLPVKTGHKK